MLILNPEGHNQRGQHVRRHRVAWRDVVAQIHINTRTTGLRPDAAGREIVHAGFAHAVLTAQANHAAPLVDACARALSACLAQVAYRQTVVVNHTDSRILSTDARNRCDLILVTVQEAGAEGTGKGMEMVVCRQAIR